MHARVTQVSVQPDKVDEAISIYEGTIDAARQQSGFVRALLVGDRSTGRSYSITLWETEADEQTTLQDGFYQAQIARFASVFAQEPMAESFEVLFEG